MFGKPIKKSKFLGRAVWTGKRDYFRATTPMDIHDIIPAFIKAAEIDPKIEKGTINDIYSQEQTIDGIRRIYVSVAGNLVEKDQEIQGFQRVLVSKETIKADQKKAKALLSDPMFRF